MNRLENAWNMGGEEASYAYNGLGHRTGRETNRGREDYLIDLTRPYHNMLMMTDAEKSRTFYWDGNVSAMSESRKAGTAEINAPDRATDMIASGAYEITPIFHYYLQDDLGSPLRVSGYNTDTDGKDNGYLTYGYYEFGNDLYDSLYNDMEDAGIPNPYSRQGGEQPFGYTGYRRDDISGTYFAQAREYQPQNGRFTAEDVIKGNVAVPETLNQYGYCWGNPVKYIDKNGESPALQQKANEIIWNYFLDEVNSTITAIEIKVQQSINSFTDAVDNCIQSVKDGMMDTINTVVQTTKTTVGKYNATNSLGYNFSGTLGIWQFDISIGGSMDTKGNVGIQGTFANGVTGGSPSWAFLKYGSISNAPDIFALEKSGVNIGGSVNVEIEGIPLVLGGDFNFIGDVNSKPYDGYYGVTGSYGIGSGNELHVENGYTITLVSINVFDVWDYIYNNYKGTECEVGE